MVIVAAEALERWLAQVFEAAGLTRDDAVDVARNLAQAEHRGVTSHGLQLLPVYLKRIRAGGIRSQYKARVLVDTPTRIILDADGAPGQVLTRKMVEETVRRAANSGVAHGAVVNSNHAGMLATYAIDAARNGAIVLISTTAGPSVFPPEGQGPSIGNNAFCFAAPTEGEPLVFDTATGIVACGKIRFASLHGQKIPESWLADANGRPSSDPHTLDRGGAVPSFGLHKGFGLAILVDVLAAILVEAPPSPELIRQRGSPSSPTLASQSCVAFFPESTLGGDSFANRVNAYVMTLRNLPAPDSSRPVIAPGDPELQAIQMANGRGGIAVSVPLRELVESACKEHGLQAMLPFPT